MRRLVARVMTFGVAAAVVAVGLVGCGNGGGSGDDGPTATVPTTPPDPYAVPAVIDEAYVNRVLAALDHADGIVTRSVVSSGSITPEVIDRLKAIYAGEIVQVKLAGLQADLLGSFQGYKPDPGDRVSKVAQLISVRSDCIFARVNRDVSAMSVRPNPRLAVQWVALISVKGPSVLDHNPTPWALSVDGFDRDFTQPEDPCAAS